MINKNNINMKANKLVGTNNNTMAKKGISVSISEEFLKKFRKYCDNNSINRSKLIEKLIRQHLVKNGVIKEGDYDKK